MNTIKSKAWVGAVAGILSLTVTAVTQAAFVPVPNSTNEIPGAALTAGTAPVAGTVVAFGATPFTSLPGLGFTGSPTTGTLRSMVVNNGLGGLDFYYQVLNTSASAINSGNDIFRFVGKGFDGAVTSATYIAGNPLSLLNTAVIPAGTLAAWNASATGTTPLGGSAFSADRDPALAGVTGVGFDFDSSHFVNLGVPGGPTTAPGNVDSGQISDWLVVRTNSTVFQGSTAEIDGGAGASFNVADFAPIPEPTTVVFGLAMAGACLNSIRHNRKKA